jgi:hypothetical protein
MENCGKKTGWENVVPLFGSINSCVSVTTTSTWLRGRKNPKVQVFNSRPTKIISLKIVHMYIYIITTSYSSDIQCNYMILYYWFKYCFGSQLLAFMLN